jgi:hypothetical protein
MKKNIEKSIIADRNSSIKDSSIGSSVSIKKIRTETVIISFIVGFISSMLASFIFEQWIK